MIGLVGLFCLAAVAVRLMLLAVQLPSDCPKAADDSQPVLVRSEALAIAESPVQPDWMSPESRKHLSFLRRSRTPAMVGLFMLAICFWILVFHGLAESVRVIDDVSNEARVGLGLLSWMCLGIGWYFYIRGRMVRLVRWEYRRHAAGFNSG